MTDQYSTQTYLQSVKAMKYLTDSLIICIQLPVSLFIFYLVYLGFTKYRATGLTFWLLVATALPMFMFATTTLVSVFYTHNLIDATNEDDLNAAYDKYIVLRKLQWW